MTTIATDGKTIAADGLATKGNVVVNRSCPKLQVDRSEGHLPAVFAVAGPPAMLGALIKWQRAGADPKDAPPIASDERWNMLMINAEGCFFADSGAPYLGPAIDVPFAFGSGADHAMTAMDLGHSPEEAVRTACRRDVYSGGEIQVVDIAESLGLAKPLAEAAE